MTFSSQPTNLESARLVPAAPRARAFAAARRHTGRVKWMRRLIIFVCIGGVALVAGLPFLRPLSSLPAGAGVGQLGVEGTRITMQAPRLSGYRADGRPYDIQARSGEQDIKTPNVIDLDQIDARLGMQDASTIHIEAEKGTYDSARNFMDIPTAVHITGDSGYDVELKSAQMDFHAGTVVSNDPVTMHMKGGDIAADRLDISDNGQKISFAGNVHTVFSATPGGTSKVANPTEGGAP